MEEDAVDVVVAAPWMFFCRLGAPSREDDGWGGRDRFVEDVVDVVDVADDAVDDDDDVDADDADDDPKILFHVSAERRNALTRRRGRDATSANKYCFGNCSLLGLEHLLR